MSLVSIKGTECRIVELGQVASQTGGQVCGLCVLFTYLYVRVRACVCVRVHISMLLSLSAPRGDYCSC